jgi:eukaryotic-like serine/threonine-protein kinase
MEPHAPDARLSNYRLDRLLGSGGMGAVYLARDLTLHRDVAIKFISPQLAGDETARRRLLREARAAAALDHPNICGVHEIIVTADGRACIVMQYVEGESLAEALRRGPLEPRQALGMAADLASALAAAHQRGIIHRDVKPQNVMLTPSGRVKLLDFGIARIEPSLPDAVTESSITGTGTVAGTPAYMSPEQVRQQPLDARSDLYSLGAVLYEALTGRRAANGATMGEICAQILNDHPPPPSLLRSGVSAQHDELLRRLMAKHPEDRFSSAEALAGALRVLLPDTAHATGASPSGGSPVPVRRDWPVPSRLVLAIAASLVIIAAVGIWKWNGVETLPSPPPVAEEWFNRGVQKIRDGSYHGGVLALREAIKAFETYPVAYARLAEAHAELDEGRNAQNALLHVTNMVPDLSRVPLDDRLRLNAIRLLVTRDLPGAVEAYEQLATRHPRDTGAWVDLGRAQEASGDFPQARASYEQALTIDPSNATAHLRLALLLREEGRSDEALEAFDRAEHFYRSNSNLEGQAETLLRRGSYLNALRRAEARPVLEQAEALATTLKSPSHQTRVRLQLATVTAAEGHFDEAARIAGEAVERAQDAGLDIVAAEGLNDLATTLMLAGRSAEAESLLARALAIAQEHDAERTVVRTRLNRASVHLQQRRPEEALAEVEATREFAAGKGYRRFELTGILLASRAHQALGRWAEARSAATETLALAKGMQNDAVAAQALESLAELAVAHGALPDALAYRHQIEAIRRAQGDVASLVYDLTNRAELLSRLGRHDDVEQVFAELQAGVDKEIPAFMARARRMHLTRAVAAATQGQYAGAVTAAAMVLEGAPADASSRFAHAVKAYAEARQGIRSGTATLPPAEGRPSREILYWELLARLHGADTSAALEAAHAELAAPPDPRSPEFEWRLAAIGAAAAARLKRGELAGELRAKAEQALRELKAAWPEAADAYLRRSDLMALRHLADIR